MRKDDINDYIMHPDVIENIMLLEHEKRPIRSLERLCNWLRSSTCTLMDVSFGML